MVIVLSADNFFPEVVFAEDILGWVEFFAGYTASYMFIKQMVQSIIYTTETPKDKWNYVWKSEEEKNYIKYLWYSYLYKDNPNVIWLSDEERAYLDYLWRRYLLLYIICVYIPVIGIATEYYSILYVQEILTWHNGIAGDINATIDIYLVQYILTEDMSPAMAEQICVKITNMQYSLVETLEVFYPKIVGCGKEEEYLLWLDQLRKLKELIMEENGLWLYNKEN